MSRIFGPVYSRRLGRSLGIDIVPYKTCTFDCVYCECGPTTDKTCERAEFFVPGEIADELENRLSELEEMPDFLTLSGAGEPTLYLGMGELIKEIGRRSAIPVAVITNSSLLHRSDVRDELLLADVVLPSLDAALEDAFRRINRPHERCDLGAMIRGLEAFLDDFEGRVLFEIMLLGGYNIDGENLTALERTLRRFRLDRIQLNTPVRPGSEKGVEPLDGASLEALRRRFGPKCELITEPGRFGGGREDRASGEEILSLIERRPCTAEEIHKALGIPMQGVLKILDRLSACGEAVSETHGGRTFYTAVERDRSNF